LSVVVQGVDVIHKADVIALVLAAGVVAVTNFLFFLSRENFPL